MNDDVKEILNKLKDSVDNPIDTEVDQFTQEAYDVPNFFCLDTTTNDCKLLLDYITNLQQENERLKKLEYKFIDNCGENESFTLEEYLDIGNKLYDSEREKEDYKSRCGKAIEYIEEDMYTEPNELYGLIDGKHLLNILNGRSDE